MRVFWRQLLPLTAALTLASAAGAQEPDTKEIVKKADDTTKAVTIIGYKAEAYGEGAQSGLPKVRGTVLLKVQGEKSERDLPAVRAEFSSESADTKTSTTLISDGKELLVLDNEKKVARRGKPEDFQKELQAFNRIWMREFTHPTPFTDELNGDSRKFEGKKAINGVECNVIYVVYANNQGEARWYYGVKDSLPHRVDRIIRQGGGEGAMVLELSDVETSPSVKDDTFKLTPPEGFEDDSPGLVGVGKTAPNWTLKTPDGKSVSLAELKGKVVVMDFWATWCGPCKLAMPGVQKVHERFKDKDVLVFGICTWENKSADPAAYMKEKGYTYGLLLNGDDVAKAYKVTGIPTFYVIDAEGKVAHAVSGYDKESEEKLAKAVETAVQKKK